MEEPLVAPRRRICLLALSALVDDPRVRRQGDLFDAHGWDVTAVGIPGGRSAPPAWRILGATTQPASGAAGPCGRRSPPLVDGDIRRPRGLAAAIAQYGRFRRALKYRARMIQARFQADAAEQILWNDLAISRHLREIYELAAGLKVDVWVANDWTMLPLAARLARENGGVYVYDTHEFATEEYAEKPSWRRWTRPLVLAVERKYIRDAAVVSSVSDGIARRLERLYALPRPTLVVRNMPHYEACGFRPTGSPIRVLYHGIVVPGRGLELTIDSVASWRPEFELTIRGPENPEFTPRLRERIVARRLQDRVHLVPPVPMTALVREAAAFDIGFFALPGHSRHNKFALPNKIFEYVMAGLCLCTTDLPEIATIINKYALGETIRQLDAGAIARTINGFDRGRIDVCKQNALKAAHELCWECEAERLVRHYGALLPQPTGWPG
jgi:hypothetical protein